MLASPCVPQRGASVYRYPVEELNVSVSRPKASYLYEVLSAIAAVDASKPIIDAIMPRCNPFRFDMSLPR